MSQSLIYTVYRYIYIYIWCLMHPYATLGPLRSLGLWWELLTHHSVTWASTSNKVVAWQGRSLCKTLWHNGLPCSSYVVLQVFHSIASWIRPQRLSLLCRRSRSQRRPINIGSCLVNMFSAKKTPRQKQERHALVPFLKNCDESWIILSLTSSYYYFYTYIYIYIYLIIL